MGLGAFDGGGAGLGGGATFRCGLRGTLALGADSVDFQLVEQRAVAGFGFYRGLHGVDGALDGEILDLAADFADEVVAVIAGRGQDVVRVAAVQAHAPHNSHALQPADDAEHGGGIAQHGHGGSLGEIAPVDGQSLSRQAAQHFRKRHGKAEFTRATRIHGPLVAIFSLSGILHDKVSNLLETVYSR